MSDTCHTGQFIHEILPIEDDASQNHGELMPSLLTCHTQNTTSMSTPLVHTNTYSNNSFSSKHNRDPMIMEPFGQCGYVLSQQSMFPVNNGSHCMPHTAQFRPHNLWACVENLIAHSLQAVLITNMEIHICVMNIMCTM